MEHDLQTHRNDLKPLNTNEPLSSELLRKIDANWRTTTVGQIYLYDNPLLNQPAEILRFFRKSWLGDVPPLSNHQRPDVRSFANEFGSQNCWRVPDRPAR